MLALRCESRGAFLSSSIPLTFAFWGICGCCRRRQHRLRRLRRGPWPPSSPPFTTLHHPRHQGCAVITDAASRRLAGGAQVENEFCRADYVHVPWLLPSDNLTQMTAQRRVRSSALHTA